MAAFWPTDSLPVVPPEASPDRRAAITPSDFASTAFSAAMFVGVGAAR